MQATYEDPKTCAARESLASLSARNRKLTSELVRLTQRIMEGINGPSPIAADKPPIRAGGLLADQQAIAADLSAALSACEAIAKDLSAGPNEVMR